jgi:DHA2 family multidrug resistance protein
MDPAAQSAIGAISGAMQSAGADATLALQRTYGVLQGMISRQAAMLSFLDTFRLMAIVSLLIMPLLFLFERPPRRKRDDISAAH